ncbi:MAG TPA: membrane protein insertion efficiency factor YidD [Vicinamibacteria bacterium]|nr:membrane protein insertion efficiency factor YidD [Vicinamibacteria bacterium]
MSTEIASGASPGAVRAGVAARALLLLIEVYRVTLAPLIGGFCRFVPSCSVYAQEAIQRHGAGPGSRLALRRLLRCHPFHRGGIDPVP